MGERCLAVPKRTIARCKHPAKNGNLYCGYHNRSIDKSFSSICHYDGSIVRYKNGDIRSKKIIRQPIQYWIDMNKYLSKKNIDEKQKEILEKRLQLLRTGRSSAIIKEFLDKYFFEDEQSLQLFFRPKNADLVDYPFDWVDAYLEKARRFLGVCYAISCNLQLLIKLQAIVRGANDRRRTGITPTLIHLRAIYRPSTKKIVKIQRWWRHWHWLKNLPISPQEMRERYIPHIDKIEFIKRYLRNYVHRKVRYSHNCPYSGEDYWKIPKEKRVVFKHQVGMNTYWRYYDIMWLHEDFIHQTAEKRFVVEPVIKEEFPEQFVVEVARTAWICTRKKRIYLCDEKNEGKEINEREEYKIVRDWNNSFSRRSLYRFSLLLFDIADLFEIPIDEIDPIRWRKPEMRYRYQSFCLRIAPPLCDIARNTNIYYLDNEVRCFAREILSSNMIFPDEDNMDILAGQAIFPIYIFMMRAQENPLIKEFVRSTIYNNFIELIPR